jgi:arylsulfatase A-like enzyme
MSLTRREFLKCSAFAAAGGFKALWSTGCSDGGGANTEFSQFPTIMIVVDTLRADHLNTAGYIRNTDSNLRAFAEQAYVFDNAISPSSWTLPSYISMMNGMYTFKNDQDNPKFEHDIRMFPELFEDIGYHTVRILTNGIVSNYTSGFRELYGFFDDAELSEMDRLAIDKAIEWLRNDSHSSRGEFFMLIWLMSPHWPYEPQNVYLKEFVSDDLYLGASPFNMNFNCDSFGVIHPEDLDPEISASIAPPPAPFTCYQDHRLYVAAYDSNIASVDWQIGRLLDFLRKEALYEGAMIIVTSDHGENMIDHQPYFKHGEALYHSLLNVPLMIKFPYQKESSVISTEVRTIDILPTVFDHMGIAYEGVDGKSLVPIISGELSDSKDRPCISSCSSIFEKGYIHSLTYDEFKLIKSPSGDKLFDLLNDREEKNNIISLYPDIYADLSKILTENLSQS